ncbi:hypothetical protein DIJ64_03585 [Mycobacterium leprae]|uniref:NADP-dependent oxidoreductase domain-containing protein n=1 Tax=Mycobacterium leprae TaxID=1769 RepID=A0AAD0P7G0_MYCLR|nr:hypothetical protein DIJ64_03585 [Mycobacterium leprae]
MVFGSVQLPGSRFFQPPHDRVETLAMLLRVVHLGVNHIYTASFYESQISNELIREALQPDPEDLAISPVSISAVCA